MADNVIKPAKPVGAAGMKQPGKKKEAQVELDHDRRRIKTAVVALLGKKETPFSPDGKVNLAKSLAGRSRYSALVSQLQGVTSELLSRQVTHPKHNDAAFMVAHAQKHLQHARAHLTQDQPSKIDSVRNILGMEPLHMKHLEAASSFIRAARVFTANGDKALYAVGKIDELPKSAMQNIPADTSRSNLAPIKAAYNHPNARHMVPMALNELRLMHARWQKKSAESQQAAPAAPATPPVTKPQTSRKPRQAPGPND